jgi:hypothetical protein
MDPKQDDQDRIFLACLIHKGGGAGLASVA